MRRLIQRKVRKRVRVRCFLHSLGLAVALLVSLAGCLHHAPPPPAVAAAQPGLALHQVTVRGAQQIPVATLEATAREKLGASLAIRASEDVDADGRVKEAAQAVVDLYVEAGFLAAQVTGTAHLAPGGGAVDVAFDVSEGPVAVLGHFELDGGFPASSDAVLSLLDTQRGDVLRAAALRRDAEILGELCRRNGFGAARWSAVETIVHFGVAEVTLRAEIGPALPAAPLADSGQPDVSVPFTWADGHPLVEVRIDGKGPFPFIVDTGSGAAAVTPEFAKALGLKVSAPGSKHRDATGAWVTPAGRTSLEGLQLGGRIYPRVSAEVVDMSLMLSAAKREFVGLLGTDFFDADVLVLDGPRNTLEVRHEPLPEPDGKETLTLFRTDLGGWGFEAGVDGHAVACFFDSGGSSDATLGVAAPLWRAQRWSSPPVVAGKFASMGAGIADQEVGRLKGDVRLGRWTFVRPVVEKSFYGSVFPARLLREFRVSLDAMHRRIRFERDSVAPITSPAVEAVGLGMTKSDGPNGAWRVLFVLDGWKGAGQVQVGDVVVAIDGHPVGEAVSREKGFHTYLLERDGKRFEVRVPIEKLVPDVEAPTSFRWFWPWP